MVMVKVCFHDFHPFIGLWISNGNSSTKAANKCCIKIWNINMRTMLIQVMTSWSWIKATSWFVCCSNAHYTIVIFIQWGKFILRYSLFNFLATEVFMVSAKFPATASTANFAKQANFKSCFIKCLNLLLGFTGCWKNLTKIMENSSSKKPHRQYQNLC